MPGVTQITGSNTSMNLVCRGWAAKATFRIARCSDQSLAGANACAVALAQSVHGKNDFS